MKKIIISSIIVLLLVGCGSKKKVTSYNKGYEVTVQESKKETNTQEVKVGEEKKDVKESTEKHNDITTVIDIIFGKDGRPESARITQTDKSKRNTNKADNTVKSDSTATNTSTSETDIYASESETENESEYVEPSKGWNPVYKWIGAALALCIVGLVVWKVIFKK